MNLYLVRHGETDYNVNHIIQGIIDKELNENGIQQAKNLKNKIDKISIDLIISSPLNRAKDTASIIIFGRNIKTIYDERIIERNAGKLEGKPDKYYDSGKAWNYKLNSDLGCNIETVNDLLFRTRKIYFSFFLFE